KVEVGIQLRVLVVLYAVIFIAHTEIQHEVWSHAERIVHVGCPLVVAVTTSEVWRTDGQVHTFPGDFPLRKNGSLKLIDVAGDEIAQRLRVVALSAEAFNGILISAKRVRVLDVNV